MLDIFKVFRPEVHTVNNKTEFNADEIIQGFDDMSIRDKIDALVKYRSGLEGSNFSIKKETSENDKNSYVKVLELENELREEERYDHEHAA